MSFSISESETAGQPADAIRSDPTGFTLIEIVIAMGLLTIVSGAIVSLFVHLTRSYTTQYVAADVQQVVRAGIDFMAHDIRMAGLDPQMRSGAGIEQADSARIQMSADQNMNGSIDATDSERISYFLNNGDQLYRQLYADATTNEPLVDHVLSLTFSYLDAGNADLGSPVPTGRLADIRTVVVAMTVQEPAGRGGMVNRTYTTRVRCRNLGL